MRFLFTLVAGLVIGLICVGAMLAALVSGHTGTADVLAYIEREGYVPRVVVMDLSAGFTIYDDRDGRNGNECALSWSPDGQRLAFTNGGDYVPADIFTFDVFSRRYQQMTFNRDQDIDALWAAALAKWSPDGEWLAYINFQSGDPDLYLVGADGGNRRLLYDIALNHIEVLRWSPDGRYLSVDTRSTDTVADYTILVIDVDSGVVVRRVKGRGAAWSTDGAALAYYQQENGTNIMRLHMASSQVITLTQNGLGAAAYDPVWAPDGTLYHMARLERDAVYIARLNPGTGSSVRLNLPLFTDIHSLTVSADGRQLAFVARNALDANGSYDINAPYTLYVSAADGRDLRAVAAAPDAGSAISLAGLVSLCGAAWQP